MRISLVLVLLISALTLPSLAQTSSVADLISGLKSEIRVLASEGAAKAEYRHFVAKHKLTKLSYFDYLKSKVAFECSRDAGLWHIGYEITDEEPSSIKIWNQWKRFSGDTRSITAKAECDEVSALYAVIARRLGVRGIGLFWPTSNHTVAVWTVEGKRIVVPTTPIFLERYDGFDAKGFDPQKQATIYDYSAQDLSDSNRLPKPLVKFFLSQVRNYGGASVALLHELRYLREAVWYGEATKSELRTLESQYRSAADKRALKFFKKQFGRHLI